MFLLPSRYRILFWSLVYCAIAITGTKQARTFSLTIGSAVYTSAIANRVVSLKPSSSQGDVIDEDWRAGSGAVEPQTNGNGG